MIMHEGGAIIEGRCADCVLNLLQLSGRGPGKYGYCRLRRIVLEYPWAMVCQHYQYWGDRPKVRQKRLLLEKPAHPLLDYSSQKPIQVHLSPEQLKERHKNEVDDDIKRNIGSSLTAQEFIDASHEKQLGLLTGFLSGFNPYNFVMAVNALHHFPLEKFPEEKRTALLEKLFNKERKADISCDPGIVADKILYAGAWVLARYGRDLLEYTDSLHLKKHKPGYEDKLLASAMTFVRNPKARPKRSLITFLFGK